MDTRWGKNNLLLLIENSLLVKELKKTLKFFPRKKLRFEVHLADHCNLNCKGCDNFSPLAKESFLDVNEYEKDCQRLSALFNGCVERIFLLGGEPLLHSEINDILRISRTNFPKGKIIIVTNGILLPTMSDEFWECCKNYSIDIKPTKYPIDFNYDAMEQKAHDKSVKYDYFKTTKFYRRTINLSGCKSCKDNYRNCHKANACITLKNGVLYTCSTAPHANIINDYFNLDLKLNNNGIDIYKVNSKQEILEFLAHEIPFCAYCNSEKSEETEWSQSQKQISEWVD